jgi:exodeoxyribonuclease V alpha subunit
VSERHTRSRTPGQRADASAWTPTGTARARFEATAPSPRAVDLGACARDTEQQETAYLGWEIGRCARALDDESRRAVAALASTCVAAVRAGSTRVPLDGRLQAALAEAGEREALAAVRALLERARSGERVVAGVIGTAGDRVPLIVEGEWLYAERMRVVEERFCRRVRDRLKRPRGDVRTVGRVLKAVANGPPPLTDEQRAAVREALVAPLTLVTGGPGTGKTTIVVALLRALAWTGVPMESVAVAAPTGKAAQRLSEALARGLAAPVRDIAAAGLAATAPVPQTLHRLLGWSNRAGRFARHENDPLTHRVVIVDEASMIDLGAMDRLVRALRGEARLVLLGDADQLPSVEAGAVFRDLCASLGASRLTTNLRVTKDPSAQRIVAVARAVNGGGAAGSLSDALTKRRSVDEVTFEGVEHLDAPWAQVAGALLERWWSRQVTALDGFARRTQRTFRLHERGFDDEDLTELRALFDHHARARLLCATRAAGFESGAEALNGWLLARLGAGIERRPWRRAELMAGTPVVFERNDYDKNLFNGDQGLVVRVEVAGEPGARPMAVFPRREAFAVHPVEALHDLSPAFAMTVHKAQGSEFDHVALVLPDVDMPLLTRELVYTAVTRARRSALIVGQADLLVRAVSRAVQRHSGVAERLGKIGG